MHCLVLSYHTCLRDWLCCAYVRIRLRMLAGTATPACRLGDAGGNGGCIPRTGSLLDAAPGACDDVAGGSVLEAPCAPTGTVPSASPACAPAAPLRADETLCNNAPFLVLETTLSSCAPGVMDISSNVFSHRICARVGQYLIGDNSSIGKPPKDGGCPFTNSRRKRALYLLLNIFSIVSNPGSISLA